MTRLIILAISIALCLGAIISCTQEDPGAGTTTARFPDSDENHPLPPDWTGPRFKLSQDYPRTEPPPEERPWEKINFTEDPNGYLREVVRYVYEGNVEADFVVQENKVRQWFHAPWMHAPEIKAKVDGPCLDEKGREPVRGLTRERFSTLAELNFGKDQTQCTNDIENWAVSIFNPPGGYVVGQVWDEMTTLSRTGRYPDPKNFPKDFPIGTVVAKFLFTTASPALVPYLVGSPEITADIKRNQTLVPLRLLQVDIAVRDSRAEFDSIDPTKKASGWVFGTYTYDNESVLFDDGSKDTLPWRRLKPIGLMYGNERHQTILVGDNISLTQHLGCEGRLAGPVDNPSSSCLACHALAEVNTGEKVFQPIQHDPNVVKYQQCRCRADVAYWFRTLKPGESFTRDAVSLTFSLQLSNGILRFCQHNPEACSPDPPPRTEISKLKLCANEISKTCPNPATPDARSCQVNELPDKGIFYSRETDRGGDRQYTAEPQAADPKKRY